MAKCKLIYLKTKYAWKQEMQFHSDRYINIKYCTEWYLTIWLQTDKLSGPHVVQGILLLDLWPDHMFTLLYTYLTLNLMPSSPCLMTPLSWLVVLLFSSSTIVVSLLIFLLYVASIDSSSPLCSSSQQPPPILILFSVVISFSPCLPAPPFLYCGYAWTDRTHTIPTMEWPGWYGSVNRAPAFLYCGYAWTDRTHTMPTMEWPGWYGSVNWIRKPCLKVHNISSIGRM